MKTPDSLPEEFYQHIWENRLFTLGNIKTRSGKTIEVLEVGKRNTDSGPDFFNAKIKIDEIKKEEIKKEVAY